jgi:hypothetical protein
MLQTISERLASLRWRQLSDLTYHFKMRAEGVVAGTRVDLLGKMAGWMRAKEGTAHEVESRDASETPKFGPSAALVHMVEGEGGHAGLAVPQAEADARVARVLGPGRTMQDVASMAGAPDDAKVMVSVRKISSTNQEVIFSHTSHPLIAGTQDRHFYKDADGTVHIHNAYFRAKDDAPSGFGSAVFGREVENARKFGVAYMDTDAAGHGSGTAGKHVAKGDWNGFYTWVREGYSMPTSFFDEKAEQDREHGWLYPAQRNEATAKAIAENFPKARDVLDIMETKTGRDWWMGFGEGGKMTFDLRDNPDGTPSRSMQVHEAYLKELRAKGKLPKI